MLSEIIRRDVVNVEPDTTVTQAARIMAERGVGALLVLNEGRPRGILTDRDIVVRCVAPRVDVDDCTVEQIMTESVEAVRETDGIFDVIQKMRRAQVRRIPVVDAHGNAVGILSFGDLVAILSREMMELAKGTTPAAEDSDLRKAA